MANPAQNYCRRCASDSWLPPDVAAALVDHGHLQEARSLATEGDGNCAQALASLDEPGTALALLQPFVDHGYWAAVERASDILDRCGRANEALVLVREHLNAGGPRGTIRLARLLARQGRIDEVIALLRPHIADSNFARELVGLTADTGHDDEIAACLQGQIDAGRDGVAGWPHLPGGTESSLAVVLERQGKVDEAIAALRRAERGFGCPPHQLAALLARQGREAELAAEPDFALWFADRLEGQRRIDEAIAALRPLAGGGSKRAAVSLAGLLIRQGMADEAIALLRPVATDEYALGLLSDALLSRGRPDEALAAIDDETFPELRALRCRVLARCGRTDEAIAALRAGSLTTQLADLLIELGRPEEAIESLRSAADLWSATTLATLLIKHGRVAEAIEPFKAAAAAKQAAKAIEDTAFWRQFR